VFIEDTDSIIKLNDQDRIDETSRSRIENQSIFQNVKREADDTGRLATPKGFQTPTSAMPKSRFFF
jgi:hypothetical protein